MSGYLVDGAFLIVILFFFWRARLVRPLNGFNEEYLSIESGKYYRGILSILIILVHFGMINQGSRLLPIFSKYKWMVSIFFFLSGYGLQRSLIKKGEGFRHGFLRKRFAGISVIFLLVIILYWFMYHIFGRRYTLVEIVGSIFDIDPILKHSWFIIVISFYYIVYYLLTFLCKGHPSRMIAGMGVTYLLNVVLCRRIGCTQAWYLSSYLMMFGVAWAQYEGKILAFIKKRYPACVAVMVALLACSGGVFVIIHSMSGISVLIFLLKMLMVLSTDALLLLFALKVRVGNPVFSFLGEISLETYLTHGLFFVIFESDSFRNTNAFLSLICILGGTVLLSTLIHRLTAPIIKRLRGV